MSEKEIVVIAPPQEVRYPFPLSPEHEYALQNWINKIVTPQGCDVRIAIQDGELTATAVEKEQTNTLQVA